MKFPAPTGVFHSPPSPRPQKENRLIPDVPRPGHWGVGSTVGWARFRDPPGEGRVAADFWN